MVGGLPGSSNESTNHAAPTKQGQRNAIQAQANCWRRIVEYRKCTRPIWRLLRGECGGSRGSFGRHNHPHLGQLIAQSACHTAPWQHGSRRVPAPCDALPSAASSSHRRPSSRAQTRAHHSHDLAGLVTAECPGNTPRSTDAARQTTMQRSEASRTGWSRMREPKAIGRDGGA